MRETSARLLKLLSFLQMQRDWTGEELAVRLGVSGRTVRKDIERLRQLGYPVDATRGAIGGYRLGAGAAMPPLLLEDEEAVATVIGLTAASTRGIGQRRYGGEVVSGPDGRVEVASILISGHVMCVRRLWHACDSDTLVAMSESHFYRARRRPPFAT